MLGEPEEQEQAESQALPLYVTAGYVALGDYLASSGAGVAATLAAVTTPAAGNAHPLGASVVSAALMDATAVTTPATHSLGASVVAAVAMDAAEGGATSPETPGAVIRQKPPAAAAAGAGKRKLGTLSNPVPLPRIDFEARASSPASASGANAGAITNAVAGCFAPSAPADRMELGEPRHPKRARRTEIRFAMF
jgi:hypothetical protein